MKKNRKTEGRLWTSRYLYALLISIFPHAITSMTVASLPLIALSMGADDARAGLVTTLFTLSALLIRPVAGYLIDQRGRRLVLIAGALLTVVVCIMYGLTGVLWLILLLRLMHGVGFGAQSTAVSTLVADIVPDTRRGEGIGHAGILLSIVSAIGPGLALWLFSLVGPSTLLIIITAIAALGLLLTFFVHSPADRPGKGQVTVAALENRIEPPGKKPKGIDRFLERTALPSAFVQLFVSLTMGAIITFLPAFAASQGIADISPFFWMNAAALLVSRPLLNVLGKKHGLSRLLLPGFFLLLLCFILLGFSNSMPMFMAAGALLGIGSGVMLPSLGTIVVTVCPPDRKGTANGTLFSAVDLGIGTGALLWGALAGFMGYAGVFLACGGCIVMGALVYWFWLRGQIRDFAQAHPDAEQL